MTIEPNELHAIKASVAVALSGVGGGGPMPSPLDILDAIDRACADAAARRVIMFDADTGDELMPSVAATGEIRERMAAQLLPGMPVELVTKAYSDWLDLDTDPRPFGVAKRVKLRELSSLRGKIVRRVEEAGELHTVVVVWDSQPGEFPYSPRELEEMPF